MKARNLYRIFLKTIFNFSVLNCLYDSVSMMLRKNVEKRQMFKQLDGVFLAVDEICDGGIIMEVEPQVNLINLFQKHFITSGQV